MTAHELAKLLLEQKDLSVVISDDGDLNEILSLEETPEGEAIRLFRI